MHLEVAHNNKAAIALYEKLGYAHVRSLPQFYEDGKDAWRMEKALGYTKEELAVWVKRIKESGAKRVWAYFNNDRDGYAIKNARELMRQLKAK